jgi:hypothetical protein
LLRVHMHEHAVSGLPLAAVARHRIAIVAMWVVPDVECDCAA